MGTFHMKAQLNTKTVTVDDTLITHYTGLQQGPPCSIHQNEYGSILSLVIVSNSPVSITVKINYPAGWNDAGCILVGSHRPANKGKPFCHTFLDFNAI